MQASLLRGRSGGAGMRNSALKIALDTRRATRSGPAVIAARQQARLAELVAFARTCSPYYRRLYKDLPANVCDPHFLPPITKPQLVENFDEWVTDPAVTKQHVESFVSDASLVGTPYLGRYLVATTSGTTGTPAVFLHDETAIAVYNAIGYTRAMPALLSRNDLWSLLRGGARSAAVYATGGHFFAAAVLERRLKQRPWRERIQRVFSVLSVTMALEGIVWSAVMFGAALVFETRLADDIAGLRALLASWGMATQVVLWVGLATSMIYVISGIAQYAMGRTIIDRYPLKTTYVIASALQVLAMLALALGNGYVALLGAIASAVLSSASGPIENILIARYTPSRYHGLGFGAKFVVALGASPIAIMLIAWVRETTGSLELLFLGLMGVAVAVTLVALLLPSGERAHAARAVAPQPAPAE